MFLRSISSEQDFWDPGCPSVAFVGRSNVGKSSLINSLFKRHVLARVGKRPGCTRTINLYKSNGLCLIDTPGYGYAQSLNKNHAFVRMNQNQSYLFFVRHLKCIFLLIDSRHGLKKSDLLFISWLNQNTFLYAIVLTKCDKIQPLNLRLLQSPLKEATFPMVKIFPTSNITNIGVNPLRKYIYTFRI